MTHIVIKNIIKNGPHLSWIKDNTPLLVIHGSRAYGTNTDTSDYDYKGIVIPPVEYYHGFVKKFEQATLNEPDAVIYDIKKFFKLASDCNPNILEVLYCDDSDIVMMNDIGEAIRENRDLFLSKRVRFSFSGYAHSQLKRLKTHRGWLMGGEPTFPTRSDFMLPERSPIPTHHLNAAKAAINKELDRLNFKFLDQLDNAERIEVRNQVVDMLEEFLIYHEDRYVAMAKKIGFDDNVIEILKKERAYDQAKRNWDNYQNWKKNRNKKRAADEEKYSIDVKHAYNLVRLMRMAKEILTTGKVIVKRPDREELLEIRNGAWSYDKIVDHAESIESEIKNLYETSTLPHKPNLNKLHNLCVELIEKQLSK